MKKRDQRRIVNELHTRLRTRLDERMEKVPENWDGLELRSWFADTANEFSAQDIMNTGRRARFQMDCINNNL